MCSLGGSFQSWGRYPRADHAVTPLYWCEDQIDFKGLGTVLPYGQGRSYGDCCLNEGGSILATAGLNRFISFDQDKGILHCEAGVTLEQILAFAVPRGWFLPVSPGTQFVSVGGAIANDIHGKNHHRAGTFGRHVINFELLRSDGTKLICSQASNIELYRATIGGLGLTGLILRATFQLKRIENSLIDMESIKFNDLGEFFQVSAESDSLFEYTVAWIDCLSKRTLGRGLFLRGNHAQIANGKTVNKASSIKKRALSVPFDAPKWALNRFSMGAFNLLYYHKQSQKKISKLEHYEPFFYPLDGVRHWNRIYGKRGFFQFQCVLPFGSSETKADEMPIKHVLKTVIDSQNGSFLAVLKVFGDLRSPGLMSFPRKGVTLSLDMPHAGEKTLALLERLDHMVRDYGGALYPAKDATMAAQSFQSYFPGWREFMGHKDPKFSSSFWRRVTREV